MLTHVNLFVLTEFLYGTVSIVIVTVLVQTRSNSFFPTHYLSILRENGKQFINPKRVTLPSLTKLAHQVAPQYRNCADDSCMYMAPLIGAIYRHTLAE